MTNDLIFILNIIVTKEEGTIHEQLVMLELITITIVLNEL